MPTKTQYGVIPYTKKNKKDNCPKLILITSRTNGYWIFPKGNPIKKKDNFQTAKQEAFEEAGIKGTINQELSYKISFKHGETDHITILFPMEVDEVLEEWPEKHERERKLVSFEKAMDLINLESIQDALKHWGKDHIIS